jgi:hypothetical protein
MRKKENGIRITVLLLIFFLSAAGVLFLLSEKGEFFMEKKVNAAGVPAAKPPIDMKVPSRIETATFALG